MGIKTLCPIFSFSDKFISSLFCILNSPNLKHLIRDFCASVFKFDLWFCCPVITMVFPGCSRQWEAQEERGDRDRSHYTLSGLTSSSWAMWTVSCCIYFLEVLWQIPQSRGSQQWKYTCLDSKSSPSIKVWNQAVDRPVLPSDTLGKYSSSLSSLWGF